MLDSQISDQPKIYQEIQRKSKEVGFTMPSDLYVGSLLKTLMLSKPNGRFLEMGTGIGLSLSWMIDGMGPDSSLVSVDNDSELIEIVSEYFGADERVELICQDGSDWIRSYEGGHFDLIFADAWPGKYSEIDETLRLLAIGGFYVVDDMAVQPNWPEGHEDNVGRLIGYLEGRDDFVLTKLDWSTGLIVAVKTK
ncbi:O-methyltransferase [Zobellia galactanivorans]|uniref:O-methyltransferase n=1 Tax=Zobellia galactanivorans (strain DSM 12802 / CCUG 47099 / CIP 106680 / NCIMB 13871 / Dsij) TaxID=63186 RepID=UPI001C0784C4|nr:class I SAM-dependent methyltransferase [Zobellia galactanivorans]MBU3025720.1 class I SAM-dependent methyltransferase [Zobellia galactanivorans]